MNSRNRKNKQSNMEFEVSDVLIWLSPNDPLSKYLESRGLDPSKIIVDKFYTGERDSLLIFKANGYSLIEKTYQTENEKKYTHLLATLTDTPMLCFNKYTIIEQYIPKKVYPDSTWKLKKKAAKILGETLAQLHSFGLSYGDSFRDHILTNGEDIFVTDFGVIGDVYYEIGDDFGLATEYLRWISKNKKDYKKLFREFSKAYKDWMK